MSERSASLHGRHLVLLALAIGGAIPYGFHAVGSLAAGGGMQLLNLTVLERSVRLLVEPSSSGAISAALVVTRSTLFLAGVVAVLAFTPASPLWFTAGLLVSVPALIWHGLAAREAH